MATLNSFRCTDAVDSRQPWAFSSPRGSLIAAIIFRDVTIARRSLYIVNAAWLFLTQRISERRVPLRGNGKKWIAGCLVRSAFSRDYRRDGLTLIVVVAGSSLSQDSGKKSIRSSWLLSSPRRKIKISVFIFGFVKLAISHEFVLFLSFVFLSFSFFPRRNFIGSLCGKRSWWSVVTSAKKDSFGVPIFSDNETPDRDKDSD